MGEKILDIDQMTKYAKELRELRDQNSDLEKLNRDLQQRLNDLHGEYLELRYKLKNTVSQEEVLVLRKKILELQNELQLKCSTPEGKPPAG
ncbi:MAG: hypothetical protein R2940_09310 [Syntrophotaleaceae bacterium]